MFFCFVLRRLQSSDDDGGESCLYKPRPTPEPVAFPFAIHYPEGPECDQLLAVTNSSCFQSWWETYGWKYEQFCPGACAAKFNLLDTTSECWTVLGCTGVDNCVRRICGTGIEV